MGDFHREGYQRVTEVLDHFAPPELVDWKVRVGNREANRVSKIALGFGSTVDEMIRAGKESTDKDPDEVKNCMKAWKSWKLDFEPRDLTFPERLFCEKRMITGEPDLVWNCGYDLGDIKTSSAVRESYFFQMGAYASMREETPRRLSVVRLDKKSGLYEFVTNEKVGLTVADCINGYNGLLLYYRMYKKAQSALKEKEIPKGEI